MKYNVQGPKLLGLAIEELDHSDDYGHMAYRITINTSYGPIVIRGDHDSGPDLIETDILKEDDYANIDI